MDHFRVFGIIAYVHAPKQKRNKLDERSMKGVIVGCYENSQYKVWLRETDSPVLSRHVNVLYNSFPSREWYDVAEED